MPPVFGHAAATTVSPNVSVPAPDPTSNNSTGAASHAHFHATETVFSNDDPKVDKKTPADVWRYIIEHLVRFTG